MESTDNKAAPHPLVQEYKKMTMEMVLLIKKADAQLLDEAELIAAKGAAATPAEREALRSLARKNEAMLRQAQTQLTEFQRVLEQTWVKTQMPRDRRKAPLQARRLGR